MRSECFFVFVVQSGAVYGLTMVPVPAFALDAWRGNAPQTSSALSGDVIDGGPTTGAQSTLPAFAYVIRCDGWYFLSRLFQVANDASPAGLVFEFFFLAFTH